ncbi:N-carbamoylputrescine amidase [Methylomarinovum tepidoasis]|uniref:N-carbamoylputrescine amidase n=1 Tax=Methylomarinovum tepidoasis TaxID=2840183 RepID=A0AAU9CWR9_9GAMM|nr:carbon-nitrogen hydrolase [Methylomarinovum sp. IN45]BCX88604.1 N-carbamoylputrescine amidase [Methylomarinovum sp. IN45]
MPETIRIAAVQQACCGSREENLRRLSDATRKAAAAKADLVIWPELHNGPYFCQTENPEWFDLAETIPGPGTETVGRLAAELQIVIVASLFEKRAPGLYHNTAVVFERDGNIAGKYRKMHIPDDPGFHEKFYFTPGDTGFKPIPTSVGKLGVLVCWDQWYPEAARLMTLAGADILIYPTAIGWDPRDDEEEKHRQLEAWRLIQRSHAVANGLPVVSCNRIGLEPNPSGQTSGIDFWGHSFICGPQGEYLARAKTEETLVSARVDLARTEKTRRIWPYLRDRRIDAYEGLARRWLDD